MLTLPRSPSLVLGTDDPKLLYFTGFRYTTNQSAITWAAPEWGACCGGYTFPKDAITTIEPGSGSTEGSSATATSGCPSASASRGSSPVDDTDWKTIWGVA